MVDQIKRKTSSMRLARLLVVTIGLADQSLLGRTKVRPILLEKAKSLSLWLSCIGQGDRLSESTKR